MLLGIEEVRSITERKCGLQNLSEFQMNGGRVPKTEVFLKPELRGGYSKPQKCPVMYP